MHIAKYRKALGIYQIAGGGAGLLMLALLLTSVHQPQGLTALILLLAALFFMFSILAGWLCLRQYALAFTITYINQLLQVPALMLAGFGYKYVAGISLGLGIHLTHGFELAFSGGLSAFELQFNQHFDTVQLEVNLVAWWLLWWMDKQRRL
ncbi:MAG TPA: hypothetical protein PKD90_17445, partial [Phnomibacter sp.]|nr:hypothetical protein [Phnomibacter sp.]